jgi:regulator of protease activity HflC (stomatin/prohibitin superfamily)
MNKLHQTSGNALIVAFVIIALIAFAGGIGGCMWGYPNYRVYQQRLAGQAQLAHAQASKEVAVAEAKAKMESASLLAQAEVARAKGVAEANQIIGASLKENEAYLRYLWINGLEANNPTVIYVPTEAGLPILEAGRFGGAVAK